MKVRIVNNSKLAKFLGHEAFVLGGTIYVRGETASPSLMRHELVHVEQYDRLGTARFLLLYLWHQIRYGYERNPLEIEAREAE